MKQVTIQQFQNVHAVAMQPYSDEQDRASALIAAYLCMTVDEAEGLPRDEYNAASIEVGKLIGISPAPIHAIGIWIGFVKYRILLTPKSSTVAHQRVLEYCQDPENGGIIKNMHLALSALSEPGKLFGLFPHKETDQERAVKFQKQMPFNRAYGYLLFFCELTPNLLKVIVSAETKAAKQTK